MTRRMAGVALLAWAWPLIAAGQGRPGAAAPSPALRQAQQAFDNLEYRQAIALAHGALRERLTGAERARAYELLGFAYSAVDSLPRAVDAFKQVVLLEPERQLDPNRTPAKTFATFQVALGQVLVVRQLQVDSVSFVGGEGGGARGLGGAVPIRFTVTQPARVVTRLIGATSVLIDSSVVNGQVNLRWPARQPGGDPVPAGTYTVVVAATVGPNSISASQPVKVVHGSVDTLPHVTNLPGYEYLPETEVPPKSWRPVGLAFLYTGGALIGTLGLESSNLGTSSRRELGIVGAAALVTGAVMTLRKPASRPAAGNILYNRLLREQIARRNQELARENVQRRQQVQLTVMPLPKVTR